VPELCNVEISALETDIGCDEIMTLLQSESKKSAYAGH